MISIQVDINTIPVRQQFAIVVLPNERNGADSEDNKKHENNDMHSMQCKQAGSHTRQPCNEAPKHCNGVTDVPPKPLEATPTSRLNNVNEGGDTNNDKYFESSREGTEYSSEGLHSRRSDLQQEEIQNKNDVREEDIPEFARRVREEFAKYS
ncbi:MAG: hypothetical protein IJ797_03610 [Selenomonadaceae bacterium]|nr:hypothetical protein [Selenomonadaceae bacterium]